MPHFIAHIRSTIRVSAPTAQEAAMRLMEAGFGRVEISEIESAETIVTDHTIYHSRCSTCGNPMQSGEERDIGEEVECDTCYDNHVADGVIVDDAAN